MGADDPQDTFSPDEALNRLERQLVDAIEREGIFRFRDADLNGDDGFVRAGLLRAILIGMPILLPSLSSEAGTGTRDSSVKRPVRLLGSGVGVVPAEPPKTEEDCRAFRRLPIRGLLDLSRLRGEGGAPLPAFELSHCVFDGEINLDHSYLGPVSLEGSRFSLLRANEAAIEGSLNLRWCGPSGHSAARQSEFFPFCGVDEFETGPAGDASGTALLPADLQLATCVVTLRSANIAGSVDLSYSDFCRDERGSISNSGEPLKAAVILTSATVRDTVVLEQTVIIGGISFIRTEVGETLGLGGARIFGHQPEPAVNMQFANFGALLIRDATRTVRQGFSKSQIFGDVYALAVQAREVWLSGGPFIGQFIFNKSDVELGFTVGGYDGGSGSCALHGRLDVSNAVVGGNLELTNVKGVNAKLINAIKNGDLSFYRPSEEYLNNIFRCEALTIVRSVDSRVDGVIDIRGCRLARPVTDEQLSPVLDIERARVAGRIRIHEVQFMGGLNLRAARVGGGLLLSQLTFDSTMKNNYLIKLSGEENYDSSSYRRIAINLRDCICGNEMEIKNISWRSLFMINSNNHIYNLRFYRRCVLIQLRQAGGTYSHVLYDLDHDSPPITLNGDSAPIRRFNRGLQRLDLTSEQKRLDYLTFFCDSISGEEGPFKIVEALHIMPDQAFKKLQQLPSTPEGNEGSWEFEATVFYGSALFYAKFLLSRDGDVEMTSDEALVDHLKIRKHDRYPNRPDWEQITRLIEPRRYVGEPVDQQTREQIFTPGSGSQGDAPDGVRTKLTRRLQRVLSRSVVFSDRWNPGFVVVVDLQGFQCGALIDGFGEEWHFSDDLQDRPQILLRAGGIRCQRVQPSSDANKPPSGDNDRTVFNRAAGNPKGPSDAPEKRICWLSYQFARRPVSGVWPAKSIWRPFAKPSVAGWAEDDDFVPQAYDEFATAHYRAGEPAEGQIILVEKKDIQRSTKFRKECKTRFPLLDRKASLPKRLLLSLLSLAILATGVAGLVYWVWVLGQADDTAKHIAIPWVSAILLLYVGLPVLSYLTQAAFKHGFQYGLSPYRALGTCALLLLFGAIAAHYARTGSFLEAQNLETYNAPGKKLPEEIALVLNVDFAAADESAASPEGGGAALRSQGRTVYAADTPCNIGVNSLLYAIDVFIPLLDLNQEERCTIRSAADDGQPDPYRWWRLGKALYEIIGWIVISLTILTLSGVMRRDLER